MTLALVLTVFTGTAWCQVKLDKSFLSSSIGEQSGVSVQEFIEILKNVKLNNGKHPTINGWARKDNIYTLKVTTTSALKFTFEHMLNYGGEISTLYATIDGKPVNSMAALMSIISSPRDETSFDKIRKNKRRNEDLLVQQEKQAETNRIKEKEARNAQEIKDRDDKSVQTIMININGSYDWVKNGSYWDGERESIDNDAVKKNVQLKVNPNGAVDFRFKSTINDLTVCSFNDLNAKLEIEKENYNKFNTTILVTDDKCSIKVTTDNDFTGIILNYRGNCEDKCLKSPYFKKYFMDMGAYFPNDAYGDIEKIRKNDENQIVDEPWL